MKTDTKSLRSCCKEIEIGLGNSYAKRVVCCIIDKFMNNTMTILQMVFEWKQTQTKIFSRLLVYLCRLCTITNPRLQLAWSKDFHKFRYTWIYNHYNSPLPLSGVNPIPTRLCHLIYYHGQGLVGIWLS